MYPSEWRAKSSAQHFFHLRDSHLFIDFEAVTHNLILLALFIAAKATDYVYVSIHHLEGLSLDRYPLIYGFLYEAL